MPQTVSSLIHPCQSVRSLFQRKDLACVFLDSTVSGPQLQCFVWRLYVRPKVGRVEPAKQDFKARELFLVAGGDGHLDLNGASDVAHGALKASGEGGADLAGGEQFVCEGNTVVKRRLSMMSFDRDNFVGSPMSQPLPRAVFEDLQQRWSDIMLCIQPRLRCVGVKGRFPFKAAVLLQFHAE